MHSFTINITDDDIVENNETFVLTIQSVSTCGIAIGTFNTTKITVIDSDGTY